MLKMSSKAYIWNYLIKHGCTKEGAAAVMGNMQEESGFRANNLQDSYNSSLGYSDEGYTAAVDNGSYGNFVYDAAGYGLTQVTYHSRKAGLLSMAKQRGVSIGDVDLQLDYMLKELKETYSTLWSKLCSEHNVSELAVAFMTQFERPENQGVTARNYRAHLSTQILKEFENAEPVEVETPAEKPAQVVYLYRNVQVPELCIGTRCDAVKALQALLCCRGYNVDIDGIFGGNTQTALATYQADMALSPDGICGKQTWSHLING